MSSGACLSQPVLWAPRGTVTRSCSIRKSGTRLTHGREEPKGDALPVVELQEGLTSTCSVNIRVFYSLTLQHNTMESLLERGEKLDDLVSKSEVLGTQSKAFYKTVSTGPGSGHPSLGLYRMSLRDVQ